MPSKKASARTTAPKQAAAAKRVVFPKLRVGRLIVADNMTSPPPGPEIRAYVQKVRSHPDARSQLIPIGSGLELTVRLR